MRTCHRPGMFGDCPDTWLMRATDIATGPIGCINPYLDGTNAHLGDDAVAAIGLDRTTNDRAGKSSQQVEEKASGEAGDNSGQGHILRGQVLQQTRKATAGTPQNASVGHDYGQTLVTGVGHCVVSPAVVCNPTFSENVEGWDMIGRFVLVLRKTPACNKGFWASNGKWWASQCLRHG